MMDINYIGKPCQYDWRLIRLMWTMISNKLIYGGVRQGSVFGWALFYFSGCDTRMCVATAINCFWLGWHC